MKIRQSCRIDQNGDRYFFHNKRRDVAHARGCRAGDRLAGAGASVLHCDGRSRLIREGGVEAKEAVRALLERLPDDCSVEDILYHLYVLQAVERGQADAAAGRTVPHEEVEKALRQKWLRGGEG